MAHEIKKIGCIGVGLMGHGIAANLIAKGFEVSVIAHRNRVPVDDLVARGAHEAANMKELVGASDAVVMCLTDSAQVESVLLGDNGILAFRRDGLVVIDCSTGDPDTTVRLWQACADENVCLVDAPLGRTPIEAQLGKLNVIVGADDATLLRIKPVLNAFAENIFHAGPVGSAHKLKLLNNFVTLGMTTLVAEAVAICEPLGIDLKLFDDLLSSGAADNLIVRRLLGGILKNDYGQLAFTIRNAAKDIGYFNNMIKPYVNADMLAPHLLQTLRSVVNEGDGDELLPSLVTVNRRRHKNIR